VLHKLLLADTPAEATYRIGDRDVSFVAGEGTVEGAVYTVQYRDDNTGSTTDQVVVLSERRGDTTGKYVAVAVRTPTGFVGSNALPVDDSVLPAHVTYRNGLVTVARDTRRYYTLSGATLSEVVVIAPQEVYEGTLVMGHEARSFTPCGDVAHWIDGSSRALPALQAVHALATEGQDPYAAIPAVVLGARTASSSATFALDYDAFIRIDRVLAIPDTPTCAPQQQATTTLLR
jgi:hypothetical protein